jgi:hypothetical protein
MPAVLEKPSVRVETRKGDDGHPFTCVVGIPGRDSPIVLCRPYPGKAQREIFEQAPPTERRGVEAHFFLRAWHTETFFKGSKGFPDGLEIGFFDKLIQPENGQPYIENSAMMMGEDCFLHLKAHAEGRVFLTLTERRRLASESEQFRMEQGLTGGAREGTKSPLAVLTDMADDRLEQRIAEAAEKSATAAVDAILSKYDLVPKKAKKGAAAPAPADEVDAG